MFRTKICGITTVDDAKAVAEAGVDAVGLNFYEKSPRFIDLDTAQGIVDNLPTEIVKVGLFVGASLDFICKAYDQLPLDAIQIHGNEQPEFLARLGDRPLIRAFRVGTGQLYEMTDYLMKCRRLGAVPLMVIADSLVPGVYGGTGSLADWEELRAYPREKWHPPLILAGGLTPQNVGDAIRAVRPVAVDTASGVESSPGRKDAAKAKAFVRAATAAFDSLK